MVESEIIKSFTKNNKSYKKLHKNNGEVRNYSTDVLPLVQAPCAKLISENFVSKGDREITSRITIYPGTNPPKQPANPYTLGCLPFWRCRCGGGGGPPAPKRNH
ncbi:hypothetical protein Adt_09153 [Abeliophyllum distichum]|uniref:Uncharacterized protein n=1 Tax=Abeliophyllum distichum TaxID=126358 RepID=A0ABD1UGE6_9LAMI